jgi:hypothetical protein
MRSKCVLTGREFSISERELSYCEDNALPVSAIAKLSPRERLREISVFRNRINLYQTKCAASGKQIFTSIPPERGLHIYDIDIWESDSWDGVEYGREYDFNKPFFEQLFSLYKIVPLPNLDVINSTLENSEYTNGISGAKNCYLLFAASFNEDCMFSRMINHSRDILDCLMAVKSELCYSCLDIHNCYDLKYSEHCHTCSNSYFLKNCQGCTNCYGCVNLINKEYYFYNEKCSKDEYLRRLSRIDLGSYKVVLEEKEKFKEFSNSFPLKYYFGKTNQNSTGSFLNNTKNCMDSYFISDGEELEHCVWIHGGKTSFYHVCYGNGSELIYNSITCGDNAYNLKFCVECYSGASDLEYCIYTGHGSSKCFGCVGLKKKSYCILNKQYSKNDYENLIKRIKSQMIEGGEYGKFFPPYIAPYYFNKCDAIDFFPITRDEAIKRGYSWDDNIPETKNSSISLPDNIKDVTDDVLNLQPVCEVTGRTYKIIKVELDFYRKHNIPLPRVSPLERIKLRSGFLNIPELKEGSCKRCNSQFQTIYTKGSLYCEKCYQDSLI